MDKIKPNNFFITLYSGFIVFIVNLSYVQSPGFALLFSNNLKHWFYVIFNDLAIQTNSNTHQ